MGKGVGFFQIIELVSYLAITFVPLALPISVLLASVLVFGNMGERYELSSLKSAGISLVRIMKPLIIFAVLISTTSFLVSNYVIPKANLKFLTRLYDIRRQKPALAIEEGVFNDDFYGYSIFVGKKHADKESIEDVIVYDQSGNSSDLISVTRASTGKMYTRDKGRKFVMELYHGEKVEESAPQYKSGGTRNYPLMRTYFDKFEKVFDLEEFELNNTDERRFSDNQKMLNNHQLLIQIDTIKKQIVEGQSKVGLGVNKLFDTTYHIKLQEDLIKRDSLLNRPANHEASKSYTVKKMIDSFKRLHDKSEKQEPVLIDSILKDSLWVDVDLKPGVAINHFYQLIPAEKKAKFFKETGTSAQLIQSEIVNTIYTLQSYKKKEILHWQQFYKKFTLAFSCIIFLFIGAPMGAIVRKGGFGYPLLIAIIFFIIYIMTDRMFEKLTDSLVLEVTVGMWITSIILSGVGVYLTYRASKDMSSNLISNFQDWIAKFIDKRKKRRHVLADIPG